MTLVKPMPLSNHLIEQPPPEFEFELDNQVPMLQLPGEDQPTTSSTTDGLQLELGAAGMLSASDNNSVIGVYLMLLHTVIDIEFLTQLTISMMTLY